MHSISDCPDPLAARASAESAPCGGASERKIDCHSCGEAFPQPAAVSPSLGMAVPYLTGLENRLLKFFLEVLYHLLHFLHRLLFLPLGRFGVAGRNRCLQCL